MRSLHTTAMIYLTLWGNTSKGVFKVGVKGLLVLAHLNSC